MIEFIYYSSFTKIFSKQSKILNQQGSASSTEGSDHNFRKLRFAKFFFEMSVVFSAWCDKKIWRKKIL